MDLNKVREWARTVMLNAPMTSLDFHACAIGDEVIKPLFFDP